MGTILKIIQQTEEHIWEKHQLSYGPPVDSRQRRQLDKRR